MKKKCNPRSGKLANSCAPKIQKQKKKKKKKKKKKSIANTIKGKKFSSGEDAAQKFNHISKGKSIVEQSNKYNNTETEQMDVDQALGIQFQEDIIMEILSRLPVRYLVQFKCVSKLWKALISDPYFTMKHLNHAKNGRDFQKLLIYQHSITENTSSMYCCSLSSVQLVEINAQKLDCPSSSTSVVHCSCNGLAVIRVFKRTSAKQSVLMLWNPSTRESIVLPDPEFPVKGHFCLGMGYDSTSGDYKILKIRNDIDGSKEPNGILVLKSGSWRNIDKHPRGISSQVSGMGSALAFVNDAFHWICISGNYFQDSRTYSLVSFSISNEVYREIPLPEEISCLKGNTSIGVSVLDGMLCAYSTYDHEGKRTFKIWALKDYGVNESWNTLFSIDDRKICQALPKYRFANGEVLFWCIYLQGDGPHSFRTSRGPFGIPDAIQDGVAFTESLISPKSLI
ncbi:hypothetical protein HAX54_041091 [Datura stramonium]|uniref:F-box domain-containing protein n=1 Tax=Datura stramonium TaxID=4076 RepID=A0ABS8RNI4_DATST|nr:hypothetical protein [Datura stramonium]